MQKVFCFESFFLFELCSRLDISPSFFQKKKKTLKPLTLLRLACSRLSDSGERCEVKGARKNKSEGGGEVREGTPVILVLNRLIRPLRPHQL